MMAATNQPNTPKPLAFMQLKGRFDSTWSWSISLAIHLVIFAVLMATEWPGRGIPGNTTEVSIVVDDESATMQVGSDEFTPIEVAQGDFDISSIPVDEIQYEEITDLNLSSSVSKPAEESLLAIESAGEDMDEMTDQWTGFLAGAGATKAGTTSFFGLEARGNKFIYVVDKSGSMRGAKLMAAKAEMYRSINSLDNKMKFLIIFYDSGYETMPGDKLVRATRQNKLRYFDWVEHVAGGGGTMPAEAMLKAISLKPDAIWLLSDGIFSENACDVIGNANRASRISIHTIAFYDNYGEIQLKRIADENNGKYRFVSPADLRGSR